MEQNIRIGKIVNAHGIKGELSIQPLTDDNRRFRKLKYVLLELQKGYEERKIVAVREHKGSILMTLEGLEDRTEAERLKNVYICVRPEDAVKPRGSYFIHELIGLEVWEGSECYGKITDVIQNSSTDLYEISSAEGTFLMPALKKIIQNVDLESGKMEVTLPEGLLELRA